MQDKKIRVNKIIGYVLLAAGIVMIMLSVNGMYQVFTDIKDPPAVITLSDIKFSIPGLPEVGAEVPGEAELAEEVDPAIEIPSETKEEILLMAGDQMSKLTNMMLWYLFMFFVASAGARLGSLGVQSLREIKVEVKGED
jgi:hypothetical protein